MRSPSRSELGLRALSLLPGAATATAEGAWVAVVYAALQLQDPSRGIEVGLWTFVVVAMAGIVAARAGRRVGRAGSILVLSLICAAGLAGWASDPAVRALIGVGNLGAAARLHGAGWWLAVAAWRGTRHQDPARDDLAVGSLLAWVVPGLAVPWLLGTASAGRSAFTEAALPATILFVAAGLVAIGVTRLDALGRAVGVDWRLNRTWIGLLIAVVAAVLAVGTPVAFLLGTSVDAMIRALVGPVGAVVGGIVSVVRPIADVVVGAVGTGIGTSVVSPSSHASAGGLSVPGVPGWVPAVVAIGAAIVLAVGGVAVWRKARGAPPGIPWRPPRGEERRIRFPAIFIRRPTLRRPTVHLPIRRRPATASEAYLALLDDLQRDGRAARRPTESPAAHARRLREQGRGSLSLDLLAADFELERYAAARLPVRELRRAIGRWRRARDRSRSTT
ncbi:MAG: hypothetical protein ACYDCI_02720 [Candidatus Limnocylindrales bacterium]